MFNYYLLLGLRSLSRNRGLAALMILTLAVGIAASVTTLTILRMMSGDPIPAKSDRLFVPIIDNRPLTNYAPGGRSGPDLISYGDMNNLLAAHPGKRRTAVIGISANIISPRTDLGNFKATGIGVTRDFFPMFEAPLKFGQAWTEQEDSGGADVVVLSRALAQKLFGDANPVGKLITMWDWQYKIVGVLDDWKPIPRFYQPENVEGAFGKEDEFMIPIASAINSHQRLHNHATYCDTPLGNNYMEFLASDCVWIQFWMETESASGRGELQNFIDAYTAEQGRSGRFKRHAKNELLDVNEWLEHKHIVGNDRKMTVWLSFCFLFLCIVNTIGLLMAKFLRRSSEVGVRRALGASRQSIFSQFLVESGVIGFAGGLLGLVFALIALALIRAQSPGISNVASMDWVMLVTAIVLSIVAALLAGSIPAWRACQIMPAWQLKSQ